MRVLSDGLGRRSADCRRTSHLFPNRRQNARACAFSFREARRRSAGCNALSSGQARFERRPTADFSRFSESTAGCACPCFSLREARRRSAGCNALSSGQARFERRPTDFSRFSESTAGCACPCFSLREARRRAALPFFFVNGGLLDVYLTVSRNGPTLHFSAALFCPPSTPPLLFNEGSADVQRRRPSACDYQCPRRLE